MELGRIEDVVGKVVGQVFSYGTDGGSLMLVFTDGTQLEIGIRPGAGGHPTLDVAFVVDPG